MLKLTICNKQAIQKKILIALLILFVFFYSGSVLFGQSWQFIRYAEDEGLSNTLVKAVTTDRNGFIWVATDDGLFRFDGHSFLQVHDELPSQYVKSVFCRNNGDLIASTDLGLIRINSNPQSWDVSVLKKGSVKEVDSLLAFPKTIYEDRKGILWVSDNHKIYTLKNNSFKAYAPGAKASTNNFQRSFSFAEDGFGNLYSFSEPGFVYRYDAPLDRFVELILPQHLSNIQCVISIDFETMLVATHNGLFEIKTNKQGLFKKMRPLNLKAEVSFIISTEPDQFLAGTWANGLIRISRTGSEYNFTEVAGFPEKNVNHLCLAGNGKVWIGSDNGLFLMKPFLFGAPFQKFSSTYIQSINPFPDGRICFSDGEKILSADPSSTGSASILKTVKTTVLQALPVATGIWFSDVDARIWFEDSHGANLHTYDMKSSGGAVFHLMADKAGCIWACQDANASLIRIGPDFVLKQYGKLEGVTSRPLSTTLDIKGKVYAGGMADTAFLFGFDAVNNRFNNLSRPLKFERNIDINVNDMAFNKKSELWLGTSFGLLKYKSGIFERINNGDMTSDAVKALAVDKNDNIWFGNSRGLHELVMGELLSFDERAGMSSKSIDYRCLYFDNQNRIWAGTVSGLIVSTPVLLPVTTSTPVILSLLLDNTREITYKPSGTLVNTKSFVTVKVGVPDYPLKYLKIEMLLKGRDSVWIPLNKTNEIILANLVPGEYTLLIRAKQYGNFLYSKPLSWEFKVVRSWYFQWWIILILAVCLLLLLWTGLKWYTGKLKRNNESLERAINDRTREIRAQKGQIEAQNLSIVIKNDELEKANIELQSAKGRAEEASEAKSKFLSVMTHELRTPMNAVIGYSHLLIQNNPRPDQLDDLKTLRFSAENLLALINNILDFNKIEADKISLEQIDFNLKNIIEEIMSTMMIRARQKGIDFHYHYDDHLPLNVIGDPLRLSQIMNNLLSNALKFTEKGSVSIELKLNTRKGKDVLIDFSVEDTGIGMDHDTLDSIFEAFTQASSETSRKYGGTGLGLAITRRLLELYGSTIRVESEPGKGTCFYFSINFAEGANAPDDALAKEAAYEFIHFDKQRILLVEDNKVNKVIARKFLLGWNLEVETADNGLIAIEKIKHQVFDLILMDLQMPEMDGYQAATAIRQLGVDPYITLPIIALTASSKADVYENIFLSGMNDFISKPFNPVELHLKIRKHLNKLL
ncbi:MAG: ATP-binding protein [Bacteroidota bacterium]